MACWVLNGKSSRPEQSQHAERVEHRLVDSVGCEFAEAFKIRLIVELKGPGDHSREVDAILLREFDRALVGQRRVGGVERAVAVAVLRIVFRRAGGAPSGSHSPMMMGVLRHSGKLATILKPRSTP